MEAVTTFIPSITKGWIPQVILKEVISDSSR